MRLNSCAELAAGATAESAGMSHAHKGKRAWCGCHVRKLLVVTLYAARMPARSPFPPAPRPVRPIALAWKPPAMVKSSQQFLAAWQHSEREPVRSEAGMERLTSLTDLTPCMRERLNRKRVNLIV